MNKEIREEEQVDPFSEYNVVKNIAGDYSIWPKMKVIPEGWSTAGIAGSRETCLDWIEQNWEGPSL